MISDDTGGPTVLFAFADRRPPPITRSFDFKRVQSTPSPWAETIFNWKRCRQKGYCERDYLVLSLEPDRLHTSCRRDGPCDRRGI